MASCTLFLPFSQFSVIIPSKPRKRTTSHSPTVRSCHKMFVPGYKRGKTHFLILNYTLVPLLQQQYNHFFGGFHVLLGFGEASPENKAAKHLHDFFTYVAVKIVKAQLESYNTEAYVDLMRFVETHPLDDGDRFCADLMRESPRHKSLALRILEVRSAYCKTDFEWDNLKRLASKMVDDSNTRLMRDYVSETSSVKDEP